MSSFAIDKGHNAYPDTGANGWILEDIATAAIGDKVISYLRGLGHTAIDVTPMGQRFESVIGSLGYRCRKANEAKVDYYVAIHLNAFNGSAHGTEVFALSSAGKALARPVVDTLSQALGTTNRGVNDRENLFVLRNTLMPAILVECLFCDSPVDQPLYNVDKIARAIVTGLTGANPIVTPTPAPVYKPPIVVADKNIMFAQKAMNRFGIRDDSGHALTEDGVAGIRTAQALRRFQSIVNIYIDGQLGPQTLGAINQILAKPVDGIIYPHMEIPTRFIQWKVGCPLVDGNFGPSTASWVKNWQSRNGLTADGVVGQNSWTKMIG